MAAKKPRTKKNKATPQTPDVRNKWADLGDMSGLWTPLNNRSYGYGIGYDGSLPPSNYELLTAFNDVVYSAIHLIAPNVAKEANKYKLVVSTGRSDSVPKSNTKALTYYEKQRITERYPEYARRSANIDEVLDHPVLDLLDRPNPSQSFRKLVELIDVYLELCGSAFVFVNKLKIGMKEVPTALWLIPSQFITIEQDEDGNLIGYRYKQGERERFYKPDEIIHFHFVNPVDPYNGYGNSPVRSVWERIQLLDKEQASWNSVLSNMTFPTVLINPPDGEQYTPNQAQRIEKQLSEKGRLGGGQGGIWVVTENMKVNPFITAPKDLSALQLYQTIRSSIATAMNVPLAMLDLNTEGAEASETIHRNFQRYCLAPRIDRILETLSHHLLPARMWLVVDSPVNPDKVFELQRLTALVSSDVITINEARIAAGYEPRHGYDKLHCEVSALGTPSAQTFQTSAPTGRTKATARARYQSFPPDPTPLADALRSVFGKLSDSLVGKLKASPIQTKGFFPQDEWTDELRRALAPILRSYFDEGAEAVLSSVGISPELLRHDVHHLDEAVNRAVLALAKSTLDTTEASVEDAVSATREAIREGLNHGEAHDQLSNRIKDVFSDLSTRRAVLIAETESSRAKHTGELMAIERAGIEARKVWLPDSMACPECKSYAAQGPIPLTKDFAVTNSGPYGKIGHPPGHPQCRCTMQYDLGA